MQLIHAQDLSRIGTPDVWLSNTQDVTQVNLTAPADRAGVSKFIDGRAYTQAFLLRRRLGLPRIDGDRRSLGRSIGGHEALRLQHRGTAR